MKRRNFLFTTAVTGSIGFIRKPISTSAVGNYIQILRLKHWLGQWVYPAQFTCLKIRTFLNMKYMDFS
jgi:hypothetical protein